jgi:hypothetical protein
MRITTILIVSSLFATSLAASGVASTPVGTQDQGASSTRESEPFYAMVKAKNTNVRTAASVEGGYPFFKVNEGDLVHVLYERFGWSRIVTDTPVFKKAFGYVVADSLKVDGNTATVIRRAMFSAPNLMQENRPAVSWEGLDPALKVGATLELIERIPATASGDPMKWKVRMPATQQAWINSVWLRKASTEEIAKAMPKPVKPTEVASVTTENASTTTTPDTTPDTTADTTADTTTNTAAAPETTTNDAETTTTTVATNESDEAETTKTPAESNLTAEEVRAAKLATLDKAFRTMLKERIESAELELLQQQFMQFAADPEVTDVEKATALSRAEVLALKIEVQDNLARLREMKERTQIDTENINATRVAMDARAPYDVLGQLNASVVFAGEGTMPLLFRLQDRSGGQTIAYIRPDERFDIAAMIGLYVGILGNTSYDETLQLNIITPRRIDLQGTQKQYIPEKTPAEQPKVAEGTSNDGAGD